MSKARLPEDTSTVRQPEPAANPDSATPSQRVLIPALIGTLAGLAVVPLQGYAWVSVAVGGAGFTAVLVGVWNLVCSHRLRNLAICALCVLLFLPLVAPFLRLSSRRYIELTYGFALSTMLVTIWLSTRRQGWRGLMSAAAVWTLFLLLGAIGIIVDVGERSAPQDPRTPLAMLWHYASITLLMEPMVGMAAALIGVHLGGLWARGRDWRLRILARLIGAGALVLCVRLLIALMPKDDRLLEAFAFTTFGQTFWYWAPTLAAVFAFEARALLNQPTHLRRLWGIVLAVVCVSVAIDRTDPGFTYVLRGGKFSHMPTSWLRPLPYLSYPPSWRPDGRGDDAFGDWCLIRPKAWDELTRRGERPRVRRESID